MNQAKPKPRHIVLIVDDDTVFRERLMRAIGNRGFEVHGAANYEQAMEMTRTLRPTRVVTDMRMPGRTGLDLVGELIKFDPDIQIIVLTGYGSIPTAVDAVRLGAIEYLTKPADAEQILAVFEKDESDYDHSQAVVAAQGSAPSLARVEWEHIQRVLSDCGGNISQAARILGIHRRSLQRKLSKYPPNQ